MRLRELWGSLVEEDERSVEEFERVFAEYIGVPYAVFTPSGRVGLKLVLEALGISEGEEVILPSFTYPSVPFVLAEMAIRVVFVDSVPDGFNMDTSLLRERMSGRTRVVIPTHLYGIVCDMEPVMEVKQEEGVFVLEDCAQSCGARWRGQMTGSVGDAGYFSFGLTKNFTSLDGGMVTTKNEKLASAVRERVEELPRGSRFHALRAVIMATAMKLSTYPPFYDILHFFRRLCARYGVDPVERAFEESLSRGALAGERHRAGAPVNFVRIGIEALERLEAENAKRRRNALFLYGLLEGVQRIELPRLTQDDYNIFQSLAFKVEEREKLRTALMERGIASATGYIRSCGSMEDFDGGRFPEAEKAERRVLHLPVYPSLGEEELTRIAEAVVECVLSI